MLYSNIAERKGGMEEGERRASSCLWPGISRNLELVSLRVLLSGLTKRTNDSAAAEGVSERTGYEMRLARIAVEWTDGERTVVRPACRGVGRSFRSVARNWYLQQ